MATSDRMTILHSTILRLNQFVHVHYKVIEWSVISVHKLLLSIVQVQTTAPMIKTHHTYVLHTRITDYNFKLFFID